MRRILLAALATLLAATAAHAQGVRYDNIVLGPRGRPVGAATIAVCAAGASTGATPCSPLATIYSDEALTQPAANPFPADSLGNYGFWAAPGHYILQIYGTGLATRAMDIFLPCDPTNCSMSAASFSSINAGSLNLTGNLTVNGRGVATKPMPSDAVQYVSASGNDSNDGLSWGTAKQTLYAAVSAIQSGTPGGGTVYVAAGTACGGPVSGQGLWLVGAGDPAYSSPPSGWIPVGHPMQIIGVGVNGATVQNALKPGVALNCGSSGDNPPLWISGTNSYRQITISNLIFSSSANNAAKIGISTTDSRTVSNTTGLVFDGDSFAVNSAGAVGPTVDIGGSTFWVWFKNCAFAANSSAAALSDAHQGVVINPTSSGEPADLIFFDHNLFDFGGIHFYGNSHTNGGSLYVNDLTQEGSNDGSPAVWITTSAGNGIFAFYQISAVTVADAVVRPTYAVKVDGGLVQAGDTVVSNASGYGQDTSGPMTLLGGETNENGGGTTASPLLEGQQGFWQNGVWAANVNDGDFSFPPQNSPWQNMVSWTPNAPAYNGFAWGNQTGGTLTQTTGPDGTNNAWETPASPSGRVDFINNNVSMSAGDYFIAAGWSKSINGGYANGSPFQLWTNGCGSPTYIPDTNNNSGFFGSRYAGQGWQYSYDVMKIGASSGGCQTIFSLEADSSHPMAVFAPVLIHVPAGAMTDADALDLATSLGSFPSLSAPRVVSTMPGHPLAFGGSGDNYLAILDHSGLTADQTFTLPDSSGTIPNFTGTPTANDCVKWGSNGQLADSGSGCGSLSGGHLTQSAANGDLAGTIAISSATSGSHTFSTAYSSAPACVVTPTSNPGTTTWWVTTSTTAVTVNLSASATLTFNYICAGNPN